MDRPRLIRGLRIAWSVMWGILCVLLIVLWVRSYWRFDGVLRIKAGKYYSAESGCGVLLFVFANRGYARTAPGWYFDVDPNEPFSRLTGVAFEERRAFSYERLKMSGIVATIPH